MGVHYRFDNTEGIILGETFAVRMIHVVSRVMPDLQSESTVLLGSRDDDYSVGDGV